MDRGQTTRYYMDCRAKGGLTVCNEKQRFILKAFKEVGFPGIAFFVMAYMCFVTINANTQALNRLSDIVLLID